MKTPTNFSGNINKPNSICYVRFINQLHKKYELEKIFLESKTKIVGYLDDKDVNVKFFICFDKTWQNIEEDVTHIIMMTSNLL